MHLLSLLLIARAHGAPAALSTLAEGDLIVSELLTTPTTVAWYRGRWLEIHNASGVEVDLDGLEVGDGASGGFTISSTTTVAADGYALLALRASSATNGGLPTVDYTFSHTDLALAPKGSVVLSYSGTMFDSVTYDTSAMTSGSALVIQGSTTCAASSPYGLGDLGTPGAENDGCTAGLGDLGEGDLLISEVMITPSAVDWYKGQWIEVYNASGAEVDLDGLTIDDEDGDSFTIAASVVVGAGDVALLALRDNSLVNGGLPTVDYRFYLSDLSLGAADGLSLSYGATVFDSMTWSGAGYTAVSGASLALDGDYLDASDNDDIGNWCAGGPAYGDGDYGSPGEVNSPCDADGDGYSVNEDCDDEDADVNPGAAEVCDSIDNDCDGDVDEKLADEYAPDDDGDGYGDDDLAETYCTGEQPSGWRAKLGDCDDTDSKIKPTATETCDGVDTNCSGDESDASDAVTYYADEDHDFYGDPDSTEVACSRPRGYRTNDLDCDDEDATVNPKGTEVCDGVDNDCDKDVDEDFTETAEAYYDDLDGDGYGDDDTEVVACSQPSGTVAVGGDCDDDDASIHPGALDLFGGTTPDCDDEDDVMSTDAAPVRLVGAASGDRLGYALAGAGDVDGDGYNDLLIGAYLEDSGDTDAGAAYLVAGPFSASADTQDISEVAAATLTGVSASDYAGFSVAGVGDVDDDGYADVLVGAYQEDSGGSAAGAAYLLLGPLSGEVSLADAEAELIGGAAGDYAGRRVAAGGDLDGDGLGDLLIGAFHEDTAATGAGAVYVLSGLVSGAGLSVETEALAILRGEASYAYAGISLDGAGDVDGDGVDDVIVGSSLESTAASYAGAAYLLLGPLSGSASLSTADVKWTGEAERDEAGLSVAGAGDVDGDGYADLLVGAPKADGDSVSDSGAAYLLLGPTSGDASLSDADAILYGEDELGWAAWTLSGAGDLDSDGYDDVLIGAFRDDAGGDGAGAAWVVSGPVTGSAGLSEVAAKLQGTEDDEAVGIGLAAAGDMSGDGVDDLVVGAYGAESAAGAVYALRGLP